MTTANDIAIAVLAAGESRRLGRPKQLLKLAGRSLLSRALYHASQTSQQVYVVLGDEQQSYLQMLTASGAHCILNPDWLSGMGSSIHAAVQAILNHQPDTHAILIMLVDQPGLTTELLNHLIAHYRQGAQIVACEYADTVGVPALFSRAYFEELSRINPSRGAKLLLKKYAGELVTVPFAEGSLDIDTQADYQRWKEKYNNGDQNHS